MYKKNEWNNGTRLDAQRLNHIENGIFENSRQIEMLKQGQKEGSLTTKDLENLKNELIQIMEEYKENMEKQKREITALKQRLTKLSKKESD